ncbi:class B sortase [Mahella sp.]|uniref:class B sortase n=1 Tax=Mahella sp. TaxID=2798721 RepID=UPI0025BDD6DD|nr:class B sortase [Mahella sp.]MBZ4665144.1 srtB [Mahella sp.]
MKHSGEALPRRILHILMILCVLGILGSAFILFSNSREYARGDASYQQVRLIRESPETVGEASSEEKQEEQAKGVDFASLEKINPDVVGWLTAEDTAIDYPVVQGKDNDFYLRHLFTGERNKLGSIFMDYRNNSDFSDKNTVIYGHNMKDGSMFSSLTKYKDQRYYDNFSTMLLYTPAGDFTIELFAGIVVDGNYESVRFDFKDDHDFQSYVDSLKKESTFKSDTIVKADDRIVTLCTCSYEFNNARYALYGKLTLIRQSAKNETP